MSDVLKKVEIPIIIAFVVGIISTFEYFVYVPEWRAIVTEFQGWGTILVTFAMGLGSANILLIHFRQIRRPGIGKYFSITLYIAFIFMMLLGIYSMFTPKGLLYEPYVFMVQQIQMPINVSMYGLIGFFIISASIRAFKIKNLDTTLLMISAVIVLLGQAPIGEAIYKGFPAMGNWILETPSVAGIRVIEIGAAIGGISIAIQILLGYERSWLGRTE